MALILTINFGATSTKLAIYRDETLEKETTVYHETREIEGFARHIDQLELRKKAVVTWVAESGYGDVRFDAVAARGGFSRRIPGGVWEVNQDYLDDLASGLYGEHVCNVCSLTAYELYGKKGIPCYVVDPPVMDERSELAKVSGYCGIERECIAHALNQKATARMAAKKLGKEYRNCRLIVVHMGGGISVAVHVNGQLTDSCDGLNGEGPFTPERCGGVPANALIDEFFRHPDWTATQFKKHITGLGGMVSYTGTNDMRVLLKRAESDERIAFLLRAMCYQIVKEIGSAAAVLEGQVDAIVFTGGLAHAQQITQLLREKVAWIADTLVFPGEDEGRALAAGALRVLRGEEAVRHYCRIPAAETEAQGEP